MLNIKYAVAETLSCGWWCIPSLQKVTLSFHDLGVNTVFSDVFKVKWIK